MSHVWIAGYGNYETTGVIHQLKNAGITTKPLRSGRQLRKGDTLVLCFSSAPLLGWGRYLEIILWVKHRYDIRLVVLCPKDVYRTMIICGRNTIAVNGEQGLSLLLQALLQAVQYGFPEYCQTFYWRHTMSSSLQMAFRALQMSPSVTTERSEVFKRYQRRRAIVQRLGFSSLLKLKIFMAGLVK